MKRRNRPSAPRAQGPRISDYHLWTEVTRSVSPLRPPAPSPMPAAKPVSPETRSEKPPVWSPDAASHAGAGRTMARRTEPQTPPGRIIEPRIRRRLMRGQLPIDATIDLHGLRQAEAHAALCRFIAARHARGDRTVLVITGKGLKKSDYGRIEQRGILRTMLPRWLGEPALAPLVAGWETAAQGHGGEGAYYVRLKRNRS